MDDYLYGRGVYGNDFSSTDPVAFRIPKASEDLCLDSTILGFDVLFLKLMCVHSGTGRQPHKGR